MELAKEQSLLQLIIIRLERIPVDSPLSHRASGIRGSLLTILDNINERREISKADTDRLINQGFYILEKAAADRLQGRSK